MAKLKSDVRVRIAALEHAMADFGPSSQHFLMNSVQAPWQRAISAYRTAMKLRAIQKRLCLDLLTLEDVNSKLQTLNAVWGEQCLSMKDAVMCLVPLFEAAQEKYPKLIHSIPLAVDLLLNFVLNIPKFFGEAAAFGGSNVEPSVRSCFESAKYPRTILIDEFLNWLKKEPQSIVWLPVMHRLGSAEFAKHQTTSGEDVRDFGLIVRNKLRARSKTKIGYLPVQTVDEGPPLETSSITPVNPITEPIHNRMQLCARRLWRARGDDGTPSAHFHDRNEEMRASTVDLKSPLQLLSQVEQMHKEELDQVLHKLQHENRELKKEIERRKKFDGGIGSAPNLVHGSGASTSRSGTDNMGTGRSVPSLPNSGDEQLLREAYLLRQHKERLEQRSRILEEQNRQLETQLTRLRTIIAQVGCDPNQDEVNYSYEKYCHFLNFQQHNAGNEGKESGQEEHESSVASGEEDEGIEYDTRPNRMNSLIASVDQLGRAMQSFVVSVVNENGDDSNDEDDEVTITGN
ncbi:unnamed protein product [Gongylonema pulchrum]|uniref:EF-hand_3 domain-containing protein n=1 Tax=Gongylonema pulchrum TaxID=637853 RepID=A0A183DRL5_9BILA|nr:unnamed protein product [Gongylonema pulchrum]